MMSDERKALMAFSLDELKVLHGALNVNERSLNELKMPLDKHTPLIKKRIRMQIKNLKAAAQ